MSNDWSVDWSNAVFSLEERDRRWKRVRDLMLRDGIDLIVCLPWTGYHDRGQADPRYLTQLGENSDETTVAFPVEGDVTAWHSRGGVWPSSNWLADIRPAPRGTGGQTLAFWLSERGFERGSIAISGLTGGTLSHCRTEHGEVNWQSVEILKRALPHAQITSATDLLGEARFLKSEEEIGFLRRGAGVSIAAIDALVSNAHAGVAETEAWAHMLRAQADIGGSFEPTIGWISGPLGATFARLEQPTPRTLAPGDVVVAEVEGRWGGYGARLDQMVSIGQAPPLLRDAMGIAVDTLHDVMASLGPGMSVAELLRLGQREALSGRASVTLSLQGCGTGDDGPVADEQSSNSIVSLPLLENCVVSIQVDVNLDGKPHYGRCGEAYVVRRGGAECLIDRRPRLYEL